MNKKGVINIVEVLVLILIFLGAAALFASFLLSSTNQQAQTIKQEQQNVAISLNPPVKVIGIVQVNADLDGDGNNDTLPLACVQETAGRLWWLSNVKLQAGTQGTILKTYNTGVILKDLLSNANVSKDSAAVGNITELVFAPLSVVKKGNTIVYNNTLLVCINTTDNSIFNVTSANLTCDKDTDEQIIDKYVNYCNTTLSGNYKIEVYNLVQFVPPGGLAPVVAPIIYSTSGWDYTSYTVNVYFAEKIIPNPGNIPARKANGQNVTSNEVLNVLESNGNMTSFLNVFRATCESCTFYTG